jgi:hypothetical protein
LFEYRCGAFLWIGDKKCVSLHIEDTDGRELVSGLFAYKWNKDKTKLKLVGRVPPVIKGWLTVCKCEDGFELWNDKKESIAVLSKV